MALAQVLQHELSKDITGLPPIFIKAHAYLTKSLNTFYTRKCSSSYEELAITYKKYIDAHNSAPIMIYDIRLIEWQQYEKLLEACIIAHKKLIFMNSAGYIYGYKNALNLWNANLNSIN